MTNVKNTKRALLVSFMTLLLCFSMLIGSTYAWFTDSVSSANNVIRAGSLDVSLEYKSNWLDAWTPVDENTKIFKDGAFYEPGYTEVVYLRVANAGTLALKYLLSLNIANEAGSKNVDGEAFMLSDFLQIGTYVQNEYRDGINDADVRMPAMFGTSEAALSSIELCKLSEANAAIRENEPILPGEDTAQIVAIVLTMPDGLGTEVNTMRGEEPPYIELGLRLVATQYAYESDSFDNQYDAVVDQPAVHEILNAEDLATAFSVGGQAKIENMNLTDVYAELAEDKSLALNTNNSIITKRDDKDYAIVNYGDLEISGNGTIRSEFKGSIENWGDLYVNNLNIIVEGSKYGFHVKDGEVVIKDLDLTAQRGGLNVQGGKVTVESGKITTTTPSSSYGIGYLVYAGGTSEVIINGGDFRYTGAYNRHGVLYAGNNASIVVNGGTFGKGGSNVAKKPWLQTADKGTITLCGGSYQFNPTQYLSDNIKLGEGYEVVAGENGWWTVSKIGG